MGEMRRARYGSTNSGRRELGSAEGNQGDDEDQKGAHDDQKGAHDDQKGAKDDGNGGLKDMSEELKKECKQMGISVPEGATKEQLIALIEAKGKADDKPKTVTQHKTKA